MGNKIKVKSHAAIDCQENGKFVTGISNKYFDNQ